ncbi:cupin domain-containing protein [Campylobacter fetus]|nr:cupin domain-containing protein [Campylobacter fetus]EJU9539766.1 AraC family ligand binding domain-containing protein [Campylobacter fetus]
MEKIVFNTTSFDGVKAIKLVETNFSKEIRISMQSGSIMAEHKAPSTIIVQVLKGSIMFYVNEKESRLDEFDLITLDANIPHSLEALSDSIIRLSLAKSDSESRVFNVTNLKH